MIKVAFTRTQSKIKINGFLSDPFNLMWGEREPSSILSIRRGRLVIIDTDTQGNSLKKWIQRLLNPTNYL